MIKLESSHPFAEPGPTPPPWTLVGAAEVIQIPGEALQSEQNCHFPANFLRPEVLPLLKLGVESDPRRAADKFGR